MRAKGGRPLPSGQEVFSQGHQLCPVHRRFGTSKAKELTLFCQSKEKRAGVVTQSATVLPRNPALGKYRIVHCGIGDQRAGSCI